MPALYGVSVSLDESSFEALAPWLDTEPRQTRGPTIPIEVIADGAQPGPVVLERFVEERAGWLGRTTNGLVVGNRTGAWFAIQTSPLKISGVLGDRDQRVGIRELLLGALLVALRSLGVHGIHAAAISFEDHALMLVGDSGAGKSTTATALVSAGCLYLGDDGLLIRQRLDDVELLPLWSPFRLTEQSLAAFAALKPHSSKLDADEKWQLNVHAAFPDRDLSHWLGKKTVLFLSRAAGQATSVQPISPADAVGLLIAQSSSLSLDCHPNPRQHLALLAQLVARARIARLELGREWLDEPPAAASRLMAWARSGRSPGSSAHGEAS